MMNESRPLQFAALEYLGKNLNNFSGYKSNLNLNMKSNFMILQVT